MDIIMRRTTQLKIADYVAAKKGYIFTVSLSPFLNCL